MRNKVFRAVRKSQFLPYYTGNDWVVIAPNGDIIHDYTLIDGMTQNEAIRKAKELNSAKD